jgi:hypothetical protein
MKFKTKSSPLKLLSQSQPNFALWLQDIEVGKQKHLHVYQADQLNFQQGVGVWNLHPLGGLHIGGIYEMKSI